MKDRFPDAWMLVLALLLFGAQSSRCNAQQALTSATFPPMPRLAAMNGSETQDSSTPTPAALPRGVIRGPGLNAPTSNPRSPLSGNVKLDAAPFAANDVRFPITLATALRLSDARPLLVAAAQARTWVAEAELTRAKVLWIPAINLGFDYIRHDGGGPDFNKGILTAPSTNFFYAGAGLWGIPWGTISTSNAIFEPLAARQVVNSSQWDIQSAKNDVVWQTADCYFRVHQYRGIYAGALYTVNRARDITRRITGLSRDLASPFEVDRARNMLADLEQQAVLARQQWRVQSARLTKVLRLDPRAVVEPLEHDHTQITIIDPARELDELMPIALTNRPEISSRQAMIKAAEWAIRREKAKFYTPDIVLNGFQTPYEMLQGGIFGIGPNSSLNQWAGRADVSIQPLIQLESIGIGNLARIKGARGMESLAIIDLYQAQDLAAQEVTEAHARVQSTAVRVVQAERALRTGIITLNGVTEGLEQTSRFGDVLVLISRPQEAVYALQMLQRAFDEYFTTVAEYNRSQFELFHAIGYPASELTWVRPPGEVVPVDTNRPDYLPPVGNGPPPATK